MLLAVVGGLCEVGIIATQMFVRNTKATEEKPDTEAAKPKRFPGFQSKKAFRGLF